MKNHQWIRQLKVKQLAKLLIYKTEVNECDEAIDGEYCDCWVTHYVCPNNIATYSEEDALRETIRWLSSEYIENG